MTWRERIVEAEQRGRFTDEDCALARSWDRCAVGECMLGGHLEDSVLLHLGAVFAGDVIIHDIAEAKRGLDAIEDRVLQVKREFTP